MEKRKPGPRPDIKKRTEIRRLLELGHSHASIARIRGCSRQNISFQAGQMGFHYIRTLVIDPQ